MENSNDETNDDRLDGFLAYDDDEPDELRKTLKEHLPAVALEIEIALNHAQLRDYPVFLAVPSSGKAIVSVGTPFDPPDAVWEQIDSIVKTIIAQKLGLTKLGSIELTCAAANYAMIGIDLIPETEKPSAIS